MKIFVQALVFCLALATPLFCDQILILNSSNIQETFPANFRKATDSFYPLHEPEPPKDGLDALQASASGQFSESELKTMLNKLNQNRIIIIDLREESHGYINGNAVSWYAPRNWGNAMVNPDEIESVEAQRIHEARGQKEVIIHKVIKKSDEYPLHPALEIFVDVNTALNERELCRTLNVAYFRLPVRDHVRPSDLQIDRFLTLISTLPPNTWLHFHCARGMGRATTMMILYDIVKNGEEISLEQIITRQWLLGGKNISHSPSKKNWKHPFSKDRLEFVKLFYQYCNTFNKEKPQSWSQWKQSIF